MHKLFFLIREWTFGQWVTVPREGIDAVLCVYSRYGKVRHAVIQHKNLPHLHFHVQPDVFSPSFAIYHRELVAKILRAETYWELQTILEDYITERHR